jgi:hypothetical protein
MPSLLGTTVAANYGRMVPQQTYGVGENQTNFGTRQLQLIKVAISGGTNDMTKGSDGATGSYQDSNSLYSLAVRALQIYVEVYAVYTPTSGGFIALVAFDTANTSDSGNGDAANTSNLRPIFANSGLAEAAINAGLNASGAATITAPTVAIGTTL